MKMQVKQEVPLQHLRKYVGKLHVLWSISGAGALWPPGYTVPESKALSPEPEPRPQSPEPRASSNVIRYVVSKPTSYGYGRLARKRLLKESCTMKEHMI